MVELIRSPYAFELTLMKQKLEDNGVHAVILDEYIGGAMNGIGGIMPRLMVLDEDLEQAQSILKNEKIEEP